MTETAATSSIDKQYYYLSALLGGKIEVKDNLLSPLDPKDYAPDTQKWLHAFEIFDDRGGGFYASWNWSAAFLGLLWFAYRKMYLAAFIFFLISISTIALIAPFSEVSQYINGAPFLILGTLSGTYGNALFYRRIKRMVAKARAAMPTPEKEIRNLQLNGGTNAWAPAVILSIPAILIAISIAIPIAETNRKIDDLDPLALVGSHSYAELAELSQVKEIYWEIKEDILHDTYENASEWEKTVLWSTVRNRFASDLATYPEDKRQVVEALGGWEAIQATMRDAAEGIQYITFGLQTNTIAIAKKSLEEPENMTVRKAYYHEVLQRVRNGPETDSKGCYVEYVGGRAGAVIITYHCEAFPTINLKRLQLTPYVPIEGEGMVRWRCGEDVAPANYKLMKNWIGESVAHVLPTVPARYLPDGCRYEPDQ